ncbi:MAG: DUF4270 domain-containing protein [Flavobacteriaceae bacterium]|nr:DUF4270 domain-containing protein [Flavobacteriaceae bacterium]
MKHLLLKFGVIFTLIIALASCEEDFSTVDTDIIGINFSTPDTIMDVTAYSRALNGVQTNDLLAYQLGIYNDPVYGQTQSHFLGQVAMVNPDPTFPNDTLSPQIERVVLYIPYFSNSTTSDDETTFTLDSIYGNTPMRISAYESNYLLRNLDPDEDFEQLQQYFSNQGDEFDPEMGELLAQLDDFVASDQQQQLIFESTGDTLTFDPGLMMELPIDFFQEKVYDREGQPELLTNNNFTEFFRGLYLKVQETQSGDNLFIFNDEDITLTMYFSSETTTLDENGNQETDDDGDIVRVLGDFDMDFSGINVNVFESDVPAGIAAQVNNPNTTEGEETLYVKGNEGIVTMIDLFGGDMNGNGIDDLEDLRTDDWIINEANLIFYVDQSRVPGGAKEPERLIVYETKNNRVLADYSVDLTSGNDAINAITSHLGRLERGSDNIGDFYKIRITTHLSNLINRDSLNVPLAVIVSHNVSQIDFQDLRNPIEVDASDPSNIITLDNLPNTSILSPEGTVLHGNRSTNLDKRLRLQIFYTVPE